ncbi:TPA: hypothetical protein QEM96_002776 [Pseudomonas putida]|nr:hypothetical protein [Pseudomonas putida]
MTTGKSFTDIDAPVVPPGQDEDWPTGKDEDDIEDEKRARPEDRDDYLDDQAPRESEKGSGRPDPSRASAAERYSYQPKQKIKP